MQNGKHLNVRIAELIFMKKDKREFSLMSEAHERIDFKRSDILRTFSQLFNEKKPFFLFFFFERSADEASKNNAHYHSDNQELEWYLTTKS